MKFNLHAHTKRCGHATGRDEDYVIKAIENGYELIGFSDHAPYIFPEGHFSSFRMEKEAAQDYADSINALKLKYEGKIEIRLGFEVEWYPDLIEKELEFLKSFNYDYLILGQHYTDNEIESFAQYSGAKTKSEETLDKYISQVIEAAESGEFALIAHPDLINFTGSSEIYVKKMTDMVKRLKEIDIPLEYNFLGYTDKRNYPKDNFWKIVSEVKNRVVIGLDAHSPSVYSDEKRLNKMKSKIASYGIETIDNPFEIIKE